MKIYKKEFKEKLAKQVKTGNIDSKIKKLIGTAMEKSYKQGQESGTTRLCTALLNLMNDKNVFVLDFKDIESAAKKVRQDIQDWRGGNDSHKGFDM